MNLNLHFDTINAGINLTGYHPPLADPRATIFPSKSPPPGQIAVQNSGPRVEKTKQKSPPPGITCLVRMPRNQCKKKHNSIKAVFSPKFSIIVHLTIFFFRENKVFASLHTTLEINTV